ncbi:hypothetical protein ACRAKI_19175 [Saccharothrix isguenensis]
MTTHILDPGPLTDVQVGMAVLDSGGEQVGTVAAVKFGDPEAVTTEGRRGPRGVGEMVRDTFVGSEPDVPAQLAERLLRTGYVKIDAKGFFATDLYADADQVDRVEADTVRLGVPRDGLIPKA